MTRIIVVAHNVVSPRTRWIARAFSAPLYILKSKPPYASLLPRLASLLSETGADKMIIEVPSGPLLFASITLRNMIDVKIIADVHTGFITTRPGLSKHSVLNYPFKGMLRYTDVILVHNMLNLLLLREEDKKKARVLLDPFYILREELAENLDNKTAGIVERIKDEYGDYIVYPASWHPDEPIEWLIKVWEKNRLRPVLVITGRPRFTPDTKLSSVVLTGYLEYREFLALLVGSTAILSASTAQLDMQHSAFEALALEKPVIASNTPAIRSVLLDAPIYFTNLNEKELINSVKKLSINIEYYKEKIKKLAARLEYNIRKAVEEIKKC